MALDPSNSSNLEQLALNGVTVQEKLKMATKTKKRITGLISVK